jgi:hypothetical protein
MTFARHTTTHKRRRWGGSGSSGGGAKSRQRRGGGDGDGDGDGKGKDKGKDNGKGKDICDPHQIKAFLKDSGVPDAYFNKEEANHLLPPAQIKPAANYAERIEHKLLVLKFFAEVTERLRTDNYLTSRIEDAINLYIRRVETDVSMSPGELTDSVLETLNTNKAGSRSFLDVLFDEDATKTKSSSSSSSSSEDDRNEFLEKMELVVNKNFEAYAKKVTPEITSRKYVSFIEEWARIGKKLPKWVPKRCAPGGHVPYREVWVGRWTKIRDFFKKKFKDVSQLILPKTLAERKSVLRADQRQLLMLLCGNVPAELFVDAATGYIRNEQQISHHVLFLTKPYRMSNTRAGMLVQNANWFVNTVKNGAMSLTKTLVWSMLAMIQCIIMVAGVVVVYKDDKLHAGAQNIAWGLVYLLRGLVQGTARLFGVQMKKMAAYAYVKHPDELLRLILTAGASSVTFYLLTQMEHDISDTQRSPLMYMLYRRALDQWNMTRAMTFLAQLQPGMFGESTVSGISDHQLGLMLKVQQDLIQLDTEILKTRQANVDTYMKEYGTQERSRDRSRLWAILNTIYHDSRTLYVNPRQIRAKLLGQFPHEFRAHHFFDSYGYARSATQIVLAYFCTWKRESMEQRIPEVTYTQNKLHEYLHPGEMDPTKTVQRSKTLKASWVHLNPVQCSEFYRKMPLVSPDNVVNDTLAVDGLNLYEEDQKERADHEVGNVSKIRARINLTDIFTHEQGYAGWITANLAGNEAALERFREISGWTHKLSPALQKRLIHEFHLSTGEAATDYKEFIERQLRYQDTTADYRPTGANPAFLVENGYDYNIFSQDDRDPAFGTFVGNLFTEYFTKRPPAAALADPNNLAKLQYYFKAVTTLHRLSPMSDITLPDNFHTSDISTPFLKKPSNQLRIQKATVHIMGLFVQIVDDPKLSSILNTTSYDQRQRMRKMLEHQYHNEEDVFLSDFMTNSDFVAKLETLYNERGPQAQSGGGGGGDGNNHHRRHTQRRRMGQVRTRK